MLCRGSGFPGNKQKEDERVSQRLLCSTGTLIGRPNGRDWRLLAPCREKLNCDGLEFMMYDTWYDRWEEVAAFVGGLGLPAVTMHCEKRIGEAISLGETEEAAEKFAVNCKMAARLGAEKMVLHLWDGVTSDRFIGRNIAFFGNLREEAERHGVLLTVENVVCSQKDPLTHWRALIREYPDILFTFDTKMAAFHGQLNALYEPENRDLWPRIVHLHVNDYGGGYRDWDHLRTLHPGEGSVDFDRLFAFLREIGYDGDYTVEATSFTQDGVIHWDKLDRTLRTVRGWIGRR